MTKLTDYQRGYLDGMRYVDGTIQHDLPAYMDELELDMMPTLEALIRDVVSAYSKTVSEGIAVCTQMVREDFEDENERRKD